MQRFIIGMAAVLCLAGLIAADHLAATWTANRTSLNDNDIFLYQYSNGDQGEKDAYITYGNIKKDLEGDLDFLPGDHAVAYVESSDIASWNGKQARISTQCDETTEKMIGALVTGEAICVSDQTGAEGTGDITEVVAGSGLSGGGTAGAVTITLSPANQAAIDANTAKVGVTTEEQNVQPDYNQTDTGADDFIKNKPPLGTAAALDAGTSPGDLVQLGAACTVGDGVYTDQTNCEANSGEWVGVLSIICDADTEDCDSKLDLLSAYEIDQRIAAGGGGTTQNITVSTESPSGGSDGDVWYVVQ